MNAMFLHQVFLHLGLAIGLTAACAVLPAMANQNNHDRAEFPGRRIGGGTRGECAANSSALAALTPADNLSMTRSDQPTLYFSMPVLDEPLQVEFVLQDAHGHAVHETAFAVGKADKIASVPLPKDALKVGQNYQWYFSAVCDPQDRSQNVVLAGWLRRVQPQASFAKQSGLDLARSYQKEELFIDELATLVELLKTNPNDKEIQRQWQQLLQALQLDTVVGRSLIGSL